MPPITGIPNSARTPGQDLDLRRAFDHQEELTNKASPWAKWERIAVTFNTTANADTVISHTLNSDTPESIEWFVTQLEIPFPAAYIYQPGPPTTLFPAVTTVPVIYRPGAFDRRPWGSDYIILRSNLAGLKATLLLCVPRIVSSASQR